MSIYLFKMLLLLNLVVICLHIPEQRNYMNDSLRTDVFLRYHPETVACACIYLSARQLKIPLPNKPAWHDIFGASEEEIKDICFSILHLYTKKKPDSEKLEKVVEDIRRIQLEAKMKAKGVSGNNTPQATGFSPSSRPNTPKQEKSPVDIKKEKLKEEVKVNSEHSPRKNLISSTKDIRNRDTNHIKKRSHSPDSNKSGHNSRSSHSNSRTPSPKRKIRTPPRGYKDARKSRSRSRSRSRSHEHGKDSKHRSHKRRRSRSISRSYSRSPHRTHLSSKKSHHKEQKSRYKSRSHSQDRDRGRERNHRDRSRSRSRSYDKYKSRKDRHGLRDGHHRSRSRERSRR